MVAGQGVREVSPNSAVPQSHNEHVCPLSRVDGASNKLEPIDWAGVARFLSCIGHSFSHNVFRSTGSRFIPLHVHIDPLGKTSTSSYCPCKKTHTHT